jgi:hypothetical protein
MNTEKKRKRSAGYLRWKRQLIALKNGDYDTVSRLAAEARRILQVRKNSRLRLPYIN